MKENMTFIWLPCLYTHNRQCRVYTINCVHLVRWMDVIMESNDLDLPVFYVQVYIGFTCMMNIVVISSTFRLCIKLRLSTSKFDFMVFNSITYGILIINLNSNAVCIPNMIYISFLHETGYWPHWSNTQPLTSTPCCSPIQVHCLVQCL